jgi:SAM-dependent methyltransferase
MHDVYNPVRPEEWELLEHALLSLRPDRNFAGLRMLELGNKLNTRCGPGGGDTITYKSFFTKLGVSHTSIDTNGKDGALAVDLRKCLRTELTARDFNRVQFDVVTNIGTTEHVEGNQEQVWRNVWEAVRPGGWLLSITPAPGDWWWHGSYYPQPEFYEAFLQLNKTKNGMTGTYGSKPRRNRFMLVEKRDDADPLHFHYPEGLLFYNTRKGFAP